MNFWNMSNGSRRNQDQRGDKGISQRQCRSTHMLVCDQRRVFTTTCYQLDDVSFDVKRIWTILVVVGLPESVHLQILLDGGGCERKFKWMRADKKFAQTTGMREQAAARWFGREIWTGNTTTTLLLLLICCSPYHLIIRYLERSKQDARQQPLSLDRHTVCNQTHLCTDGPLCVNRYTQERVSVHCVCCF